MSVWDELAAPEQREQLATAAHERRWGLAFILIGWLHLLAFGLCYYLTIVVEYHDAPAYLAIWAAELASLALVLHCCARGRPTHPLPPLARFMVRVWLAYFLLAFNLCTMNQLRGHAMFELFPAMASLASFGFLMLTFAVQRRFFLAVLVMFAAGQLMAAFLPHAYLVFGLAWWLVLNCVGVALLPVVWPRLGGRRLWRLAPRASLR